MIWALILTLALVGAARVSARPAPHLRGARNSIVDGVVRAGVPSDQVLRALMVAITPPLRRWVVTVSALLIYIGELVCCGATPVYNVARTAAVNLWETLCAVWYAPTRIPYTIRLTARYLRMVHRVSQGHPAYGTAYGPLERRVRHFGSVTIDGDAWTYFGGPVRTPCTVCSGVLGPFWISAGRAACMDCMRDKAHAADRHDHR